jgi:hypothetical protein
LAANNTEAPSIVPKQREDFLQEIGFIQGNGPPEGKCFHGASALRLAQISDRSCSQDQRDQNSVEGRDNGVDSGTLGGEKQKPRTRFVPAGASF